VRTFRKGAAAATAVLAVCSALVGCGSGSGGSSASDLKFYNDKAAWKQDFVAVGAASKKDIGINLNPVGYSEENAYQAFIKSSFRTKNRPDLFTWATGGQLQDLVKQNLVADTSDTWKKAVDDGNVPADLEQYFTIDGKQYCVPLSVGYWVMYYNKKVFADHNITPPTTWQEMMDAAAKLKSAGVTPFYHTNVLFSFAWFETLLAGTDPDEYVALSEGKAKYTDPSVVHVMSLWKDMIDKGYFNNPGIKTDPQTMLKTGQVAMANFGTWFSGSLNTLGMKSDKDYGFFTIPNVDPSLPKTSVIVEAGPVCSANNAPNKDAVDKWTTWWFTPSAQSAWSKARGDISFNPKAKSDDPLLTKEAGYVGGDGVRLLNRYFEATPPPVLTAALDAFGAFVTHPDDGMSELKKIQAAADTYWASNS
jgi:ABC-type glycerol-3-phosphate transport system substrate-binding protein